MKSKVNIIFWSSLVLGTIIFAILIYLRTIRYNVFNSILNVYSVVYIFYMLSGFFLWYSINILKLKRLIAFSILFFAIISQQIWIQETIRKDWTGLIWLTYFHVAFVIIYLLFMIWIAFLEYHTKTKIKVAIVRLIFYSIIFIGFLIYAIDNLFLAIYGIGYFPQFVRDITRRMNVGYYVYLSIIIFFALMLIFVINIIIIFAERKIFQMKIIRTIFIPIIFVPIYTALLTRSYGLLDWEHWLKTGNIIFSVILYECTYIAFVKTKMKIKG